MTEDQQKADKLKQLLEDAIEVGSPWVVDEEGVLRPDVVVEL